MGPTLYQWFFFLFASLAPSFFAPATAHSGSLHPFYVSVVEIDHNPGDQSLEVSCKIFVDDLEETLKKNFNTPVDLASGAQEKRNEGFIRDYIARHLLLNVDGKAAKMEFVGFEREKAYVWCYFEIPRIPSVKKLDLTNSLLHDFKPEQINIMHVKIGGERKSYKLEFPNTRASFSF